MNVQETRLARAFERHCVTPSVFWTIPEFKAPSRLSEVCMHVITLTANMDGAKCFLFRANYKP